jgi:hypothetical protein
MTTWDYAQFREATVTCETHVLTFTKEGKFFWGAMNALSNTFSFSTGLEKLMLNILKHARITFHNLFQRSLLESPC